MGSVTAREVTYKIIGDTREYTSGIQTADKQTEKLNKTVEQTEKALSNIGKYSAIATTALIGLGVAAGKVAMEFNAALAPTETLIPGQTARINELKAAIQGLSPAVRKTTDDLAAGAYNIISAYGDADDTVQKLEISAKAAKAGVATTNDAINLLSANTKAYGDTSAIAQQKVADLAFVTLRNGQTSFPELASSMQRVTSLSATLKISQEELFAVFASGTGVIGGAAEVATKTAAAQAELLRGTDRLQEAFKTLGVTSGTELIQKFGGFQGALTALKGYADNTGVSITNLFGSIEAGQIALYLTGQGAEKFTRDMEDMRQAAGALDTAFEASTTGVNSFADQLTQSQLSLTVFAQRIGDEVLESASGFMSTITDITAGLADMDKGTLETIVSAGKIILVITGTTAAVAGLTKGLAVAKVAVTALTGAISANPIGIAIVALTAAVAAFLEINKRLETAYVSQIDKSRRASQQLSEEIEGLKKGSQEYKTRADTLGNLITKYEDLSREAGDNEQAQAELQATIKKIGTIAPDAITQWDSFGNALTLNADKAKQARDLFTDIARQELELSIIKTSHFEESLKSEMADLEKWVKDNTAKALSNEAIVQQVSLEGAIKTYLENIDIQDAMERAVALEESTAELLQKVSDLGFEDIFNPAGAIAKNEELKKAAEQNKKDLAEYITKNERLIEIRRELAQLAANRENLNTLNKPPQLTEAEEVPVAKKADKTQGQELKELDDKYAVQIALAKEKGQDIFTIEQDWQTKRLALLQDFVVRDTVVREKGVSIAKAIDTSLNSSLAEGYGKVVDQLSATENRLQALSGQAATLHLETSISFLTDQGLTVEEALTRISDEARKTADSQLNNAQKLASEKSVLIAQLNNQILTEESSAAIRSRLDAVTKGLADAERERVEALMTESAASSQLLDIDITRIGTIAAETEKLINDEIALKKELGLLGSNEKEIKRNELQEKHNLLLEKQRALMEEYNRLQNSGKDGDSARAEATKKQLDEISKAAQKTGKELEGSYQSTLEKVAGKVSDVGGLIKDAVTNLANIMTAFIDRGAEKKAREYADTLANIEEEKTTRLYEINEQYRMETEEREAAQREREYNETIYQYERNLKELQGAFQMETNLEKLRELEKKIEDEKRKKREAQQAKKEADEELKRQNDYLNTKNQMEWEYTVQQVETENAAGIAASNAAIEKAKWEKASTVVTLSLLAAENTAKAAASFSNPIQMIGYIIAAASAGVQAGLAASQPDPPAFRPQPLPPKPRMLAEGGIFMPSAGGTAIMMASGQRAVVAEANVPELYLPITPANIDALISAVQGAAPKQESFVYSPVYSLYFSNNEGDTKETVFAYLKNEVSRDLLEVVEDARKRWYVGA